MLPGSVCVCPQEFMPQFYGGFSESERVLLANGSIGFISKMVKQSSRKPTVTFKGEGVLWATKKKSGCGTCSLLLEIELNYI